MRGRVFAGLTAGKTLPAKGRIAEISVKIETIYPPNGV
jgi:hypothetical protein